MILTYSDLSSPCSKSGPHFPDINGEAPVYGPPYKPNDLVVLLAQKLGAIIVTLEHRYYGKSVPFSTQSTDNLQYLNTKQALADLANFITDFQVQMNSGHHCQRVNFDKPLLGNPGSFF